MIDFSKLVPLYLEPHRHYHNLQHIHTMIRMIPDIRQHFKLIDSDKLIRAIWYHDAYYDPLTTYGLNEEMSAYLYVTHCEPDYSGGPEVTDMIAATEYHCITQDTDCETTKVFLDLDMHFIGLGPITYNRNVLKIEREYLDYGVTFDKYRDGRIQFLNLLMERYKSSGSIFYTDYFKDKYCKQAKLNIMTELNSLRGP